MPIRPPALDDRSFDDLVQELIGRVPAHVPEWLPRTGDPGWTLVELFAWLADATLYRANLIPERQRLAFLRLLGEQMRPAVPAQTLITVQQDDDEATTAVTIRPYAQIDGPAPFETRSELTVLPITAEAFYKRKLTTNEKNSLLPLLPDLRELYKLAPTETAVPYTTTPIFADGMPVPGGFDLAAAATDSTLWLALLATKPDLVTAVRTTLGKTPSGSQQLISIGIVPTITVPALDETIGPRARIPHIWEISGTTPEEYHLLDPIQDGSYGLTQQGVQRLTLPASANIGTPTNDVRTDVDAGIRDRPPRLDDPDKAERLVAWLRLRPSQQMHTLSLSWVGVNAVAIDQRQTVTNRIIGQSDGSADQEMRLATTSIEPDTLRVEIEEAGRGYQPWTSIPDLTLAGRDDAVYQLDSEAGTIQFGDRLRGRVPQVGSRVRVAHMRIGGGASGNLPPASLTGIRAQTIDGKTVTNLKVNQPLAATGGADAETLAAAERRIPNMLRHRERAITPDDYRQLAANTPGIQMGRVELLPRFKPQQRRSQVAGVVSVMVLPQKEGSSLPNPRADRPFLEAVHAYLDERRPLGTELYVIGCEYIPLGVSVSVQIGDGFGQEEVLRNVRQALRDYLWPLPAGGPQQTGWPLGRSVNQRELEVVVARVTGINGVFGLNLFAQGSDNWQLITNANNELTLQKWQLPELLSVVVVAGQPNAPGNLSGVANPFANTSEVGVPVVPEMCA